MAISWTMVLGLRAEICHHDRALELFLCRDDKDGERVIAISIFVCLRRVLARVPIVRLTH